MVARTQQQDAASPLSRSRSGFTLVELLMVIMIIGVLSTFVLVALAGVTQTAREDRTKAQIKKIHELIFEKWEQYRYRRVPLTLYMAKIRQNPLGNLEAVDSREMARHRLIALRELMRMEMPSFQRDVATGARFTVDSLNPSKKYAPSLWRAYRQRAGLDEDTSNWTSANQQAECLYLILSQIRDADSSALEFFKENEIGDVDGDGMNEILDAWGNPIVWMLWAPGHLSPMQVAMAENQEQDDAFDPSTYGSGYDTSNFSGDFAQLPRTLYPLIYSAGADGKFGIIVGTNQSGESDQQGWDAASNDPYNRSTDLKMFLLGAPSVQQPEALADDISNHYLTTR